jgi:hypothetical protein
LDSSFTYKPFIPRYIVLVTEKRRQIHTTDTLIAIKGHITVAVETPAKQLQLQVLCTCCTLHSDGFLTFIFVKIWLLKM